MDAGRRREADFQPIRTGGRYVDGVKVLTKDNVCYMAVNLIRTRTNDGFALSRPALAATARTGSARPVAPREPSGQDVTRRPSRSVEFPAAHPTNHHSTLVVLSHFPLFYFVTRLPAASG